MGVDKQQVLLQVTTAGVGRVVEVEWNDQAWLADPVFRAFAERAWRAVLDPRCATCRCRRPCSAVPNKAPTPAVTTATLVSRTIEPLPIYDVRVTDGEIAARLKSRKPSP
jgi:hypothetical protein